MRKDFSIKELIESGSNLIFKGEYDDKYFLIKLLFLREVSKEEISDVIDSIGSQYPVNQSRILMLKMKIVNLSKESQSMPFLSICDNDGYEFNNCIDSSLRLSSELSEKEVLDTNLLPKFKYDVSYLFFVPQEETEYFLKASYDKLDLTKTNIL
jgi:hypothetical protein